MSKECSCALNVSEYFQELGYLLEIWNEHAKTGKLSASASEIRKRIENSKQLAEKIGDTCNINVQPSIDFLAEAIRHYDSGLMKGDVHSLSEAAEIAAETELIMRRELVACKDRE